MCLLLKMLSRLIITFLPRSKRLLISWLQSPSAVILEPPKIQSDTFSTVSPSISHEVMGPDAMIYVFWMLSLSQLFHSPLSFSSRGSLVLHFLPYGWCHLHVWGYWYFSWQSWFQLVLHPIWHFTWYTLNIKLNKQGDSIQLWCTPLPIWNQSIDPCPVLTVASWPAHKFLRRQVRWSAIAISKNSIFCCDPHSQKR